MFYSTTLLCTWYKLVAPADTYGTAVELLIVTYRNLCLLYGSRDTSDLIYHHHDCHAVPRTLTVGANFK
jgi:hypothetical protein